jgi:hypothetical protein
MIYVRAIARGDVRGKSAYIHNAVDQPRGKKCPRGMQVAIGYAPWHQEELLKKAPPRLRNAIVERQPT